MAGPAVVEDLAHALDRVAEAVGRRFSDGAMVPRNDIVHVDRDLALTVGIEEGVVRVDGGEPHPMTLRVTHGLRRIEDRSYLVLRHADFPPPDQRRS